ncbi:hypothetical protein LCGC14_2028020 [marine sediment metagenome]|uniref:Uncharacterized protein n=1 Tax=marine sediment metagenome TaxID=412755 RepID=A0A0F9EVD9_9ZZZZ
MKEVEIWQVQEWNWECPECGHDNSFTMEPSDYKIMKCGLCDVMFKQKAASQQPDSVDGDAECNFFNECTLKNYVCNGKKCRLYHPRN